MDITEEKGDTMTKFKKVYDEMRAITASTKDKVIYEILVLITGDAELKKISGIEKNSFISQAKAHYLANGSKFSDKYRVGIIKTLKVYADNIGRAGKL